MHPILYYILFFIALGGIGMAIANRKVGVTVRRQRWIKYFTYILFTGLVLLSIFLHFFNWLSLFIVAVAFFELVKVNLAEPSLSKIKIVFSILVFIILASGFILFARTFNYSFLLFIYFQVQVFDGFCQITGQLFGKKRLAPKISPSKTVEGLVGGWLCCVIAGCLAANWLETSSAFYAGVFGLIAGIFTGLTSFSGDLLASYYKRKAQVKDYSNWLPGQGGFLDRFDSLLMTGAVYYLLYIIFFKDTFHGFINIAE